jgi:hypothetical protein
VQKILQRLQMLTVSVLFLLDPGHVPHVILDKSSAILGPSGRLHHVVCELLDRFLVIRGQKTTAGT